MLIMPVNPERNSGLESSGSVNDAKIFLPKGPLTFFITLGFVLGGVIAHLTVEKPASSSKVCLVNYPDIGRREFLLGLGGAVGGAVVGAMAEGVSTHLSQPEIPPAKGGS